MKRISIVSSEDKSLRVYNLEDHNYTNHSLLTQTGTVPSKQNTPTYLDKTHMRVSVGGEGVGQECERSSDK